MRDDNFAIDSDGSRIPISGDEVNEISKDIITRGKLIMVVSEIDGQIGVHVIGKPSKELLNTLEAVVTAYKKGLGL